MVSQGRRAAVVASPAVTPPFDVAVIGAGASGALVAVHFRRAAPSGRLALIDAGARAARGLAYGTPYGAHLLNVPAARMSALADDPEHFLRWLQSRMADATGTTFAPRPLYGDYLAELLSSVAVERVGGTAVGLTRERDAWLVHLHDGRTIRSRAVVLALGNLPPADPLGLDRDLPQYVRDPWAPGAAAGLDREAPVLFIGTGLTMIDLAVAFRAEGHRGAMFALSRHGRLPRPHAPAEKIAPPENPGSPREVLRWIRAQSDWRAAVDALRPLTSELWQRWPESRRASFLRHARSLWDVHRHRLAPHVAAEVDELLASGDLRVLTGRIAGLEPDGDAVRVLWQPRGADLHRELTVARVINCTGPATDYARVDLPLVVHLRRAGLLVPDPLALGVETDADGRLVDTAGAPVDGLYTLGPLRRAALWESTAIPEIRQQAAALAALLAERRRPGG
jgi:uncharacterized NAD(P)/FAD-binding protein YdhS